MPIMKVIWILNLILLYVTMLVVKHLLLCCEFNVIKQISFCQCHLIY